jgi:hypothetical protein
VERKWKRQTFSSAGPPPPVAESCRYNVIRGTLEHLRDPAGVIVHGHWLLQDEMQRTLDDIAERTGR